MRKGSTASLELRERLRLAHLGHYASEETKAKMSAAQKDRVHQPRNAEYRKACRVRAIAQMADPAMRARLSEATRKQMSDPQVRARQSAITKAQMAEPEARQRISQAVRSRLAEPEIKAKLGTGTRAWMKTAMARVQFSEKARQSYEKQPELRVKRAIAKAKSLEQWPLPQTSLERALAQYLTSLGLAFVEQRRFGRYVVDAYVPVMNTAYEADGSYWHQDKEREIRRDVYLKARGIKEIVHLTDVQLLRR